VRAICEASPWRVAIIGSSAWSHCFLTRKTHGLWADLEADAARFAELQAGRQGRVGGPEHRGGRRGGPARDAELDLPGRRDGRPQAGDPGLDAGLRRGGALRRPLPA
jgi:hypothetical protein